MSFKRNRGQIKVPYDKSGNMLNHASEHRADVKWRDSKPFSATIVFTSIGRGRRAVRGNFKDKITGKLYVMFRQELEWIVPKLKFGEYTGTFHVVKRGANYGLVPREMSPLEQLAIQVDT